MLGTGIKYEFGIGHTGFFECICRFFYTLAEFTYRVSITPELISQLLAMGDRVEVLEPVELREEMKERINSMLNFYK